MEFTFKEERDIEKFLEENLLSFFNKNKKSMKNSNEVGHAFSSRIEKEVGDLLSKIYDISHELDSKKNKLKRALSDHIINGNLNNVKFGISEGHPNICSLSRMTKLILDKNIFCYYTTFIHYNQESEKIKVMFVNILQFNNCLTADGGTGQIMIKQKKFKSEYETYVNNPGVNYSSEEIRNFFITLYSESIIRNIELRRKKLKKFTDLYVK